jgi:hypothetical protein
LPESGLLQMMTCDNRLKYTGAAAQYQPFSWGIGL